MKKFFVAFAALVLAFSCSPEENNTHSDGIVHVTGITLDRSTANLTEGNSTTLVATVLPNNAENKAIHWTSSNEAVATVDASGTIYGVKAGSATITVTTEDGGKTANCAVSVEATLAPSVTLEVDHISAVSAVFHGKANIGTVAATDLKIGFQYSTFVGMLPSNSTFIEAKEADANYNYTASTFALEPSTQYYYRSFVRQNGLDTYGEIKSFTTRELSSLITTLEATDVEGTSATLNATVDLSEVSYVCKNIELDFLWGKSESDIGTRIYSDNITNNIFSANFTGLGPETQYWYKARIILEGDIGVKEDRTIYEGEKRYFTTPASLFVDLGLSVKWACCNLGASQPEEYGDYYAWGEIEPKTEYNWITYKFRTSGNSDSNVQFSKYNTVDKKVKLDPEDDVAHVQLGGKWHMPTTNEWYELKNKCTWTWNSLNRVNGYTITGPNGNSIFLPSAGHRAGTKTVDTGSDAGCQYWVPSLLTEIEAWKSTDVQMSGTWGIERCYGLSVRPVTE